MTGQKLLAFHNNLQLQKEFLDRSQSHYDADELIHGVYWENGKGCAYGCMTHSTRHKDLELLYGMPEWLGSIIDVLFEGMENKYSKNFYLNFIKTVANPSFLGFDNWPHVYHQLCLHILEKECKNIDHPLVKPSICNIITLHRTEEIDLVKWPAAESAAGSAARSAESASESAAGSAESAARSAAWSAESAARSAAGSAAESAAWSAAGSAAESAAGSAESATYKSIADKLIELLKISSTEKWT